MRMHGLLLSLLCLCFLATGCNRTSGFLHNDLGQRAFKKGNHAEAARHFRMAAADAPHNANYAHNLGVAMLKQGNPGQAEQLFRHALEVDPMHQPSYHSLASLLKEQNRHEEATAMLTEWSETQPYLAEPHVELAWMNRETGNHLAAEQHLRQALRVDPSNATALAHLGQVYDDQGRSGEALAMYRRSLYQDWNQHRVKSRVATLTGQPTRHPYPTGARLVQGQPVQWQAAPQLAVVPGSPVSQTIPGPQTFPAAIASQPYSASQIAAAPAWTSTPSTITQGPVPQPAVPGSSAQPQPLMIPTPEPEWSQPVTEARTAQPDERLSMSVPLVEAH